MLGLGVLVSGGRCLRLKADVGDVTLFGRLTREQLCGLLAAHSQC
jgi:hypothetical protein